MNGQQLEAICDDYGVTKEELKTAAVVELLIGGKLDTDGDLRPLADRITSIMSQREAVSAIKWATWIKHAREHGLEGQDIPSLLKLRKAG